MSADHRLEAGCSVSLKSFPTRADNFHNDRHNAEKEFRKLRDEFIKWQAALYAEHEQKILIVLQAIDAGGKDGTIRKILKGVNPQGVRVTSFKKPTVHELERDFLWRVHRCVPAKGMIGVFNRSHYEDVLAVRVNRLVPVDIWECRYDVINQFEQHLASSGTRILKFFLHISKEEQKQRFQDRIDDPDKHWKFDADDLAKRELWDDYRAAFEDMLNRCTTTYAPWYVIPADQKWYRNLAIMRAIVSALREMNPQYPKADDLSHFVIS